MNIPGRPVAFVVVLGLAFGGAALAGAVIDPTDNAVASAGHGTETGSAGSEGHSGGHGGGSAAAAAPSGLAVSEGGYTLEIDRSFLAANEAEPFTFRVTDGRGSPVRDEYELEHEKELHLIVVRRDTATFEHVHPRKGEDGTWSVDLNLRQPGVYRAYADFKIDGERRTLASDLFVPGEFRPAPLPGPQSTAQPVDSAGTPADDLDVTLQAPGLRAGTETPLRFAVTRSGQPFEALEPYLGAKGHLVALREGDLAYLHAHPLQSGFQPRANEVPFAVTFPTAGRYRLFLQFKTGGEIRTVAYTVEVPR